MRRKTVVGNAVFICTMSVCITALMTLSITGRSPKEKTSEPTTQATIVETTEYISEPTETEMPTEAIVETTEATTEPIQIYNVPLDADLQLHIIRVAEAHGIDPAIVMAMADQESTYNPNCIGDGGHALGLFQVQPYWHRDRMERLGCPDLLDPYQNAIVAIDYLYEMLTWYGTIEGALTAYQQGHYNGEVTWYARSVLAIAKEIAWKN